MSSIQEISIVITSINQPTKEILEISRVAKARSLNFIVIGDANSPEDFKVKGCTFYSLNDQLMSHFAFAHKCPTGHYARKNIGYLYAIAKGSSYIVETDDDNMPLDDFWQPRKARQKVSHIAEQGWVNVYRYFTKALTWPRGFPLCFVQNNIPPLAEAGVDEIYCPIQQGLADGDPDVDAIYRLILPLPLKFENHLRVALGQGSWCPFNSQNTTWFPDAYPLLYLPAYCSFRMTDIFRSFVAQSIAWANDWSILFHEPTVHQERNKHNLMKDFGDEVIGYMNNEQICERLGALSLQPGKENIAENMSLCYEELIRMGVVEKKELALLNHWLTDLSKLS